MTLALIVKNISKCSYSSRYFLSCRLSFLYSRGVNGKEVISQILFCLKSFQMIANGERKFLPLSLVSQLSQDLHYSFKKKSRFVEEVLF